MQRDRQTDRDKDRGRKTDSEIERDRQTEIKIEAGRQTAEIAQGAGRTPARAREAQAQTEIERQEMNGHTHTHTHTHTDRWRQTDRRVPGMALAQCTTVTSCLSPSSLRLVSRELELSGSRGSWPAWTTVGSMACSWLSRDRQECRLWAGPWGQGGAGRRQGAGQLESRLVNRVAQLVTCCLW